MKEISIEHVISWGIALILFMFFAVNGYPKLVGADPILNKFQDWGYTANFARVLGLLELIGAILVLIPRTAFWGSLLLALIMVGALYTHFTFDLENLPQGAASLKLSVTLFVLALIQMYLTRGQRLAVG